MKVAYKGFTPQADGTLKCRDKIYKVGETYVEDAAIPCKKGMHACLQPIEVLSYYSPNKSAYHEVEVGDDAQGDGLDSKVASKTLKVGASLGIPGLVKAQVEYVTSRKNKEEGDHATGDYSAASSTGNYSAASSIGNYCAAASTGHRGAASSTGNYSAASSTGDYGAATSTGYQGAASSTGDYGAASSTGDYGAASSTGKHSVALAAGYAGRARGAKGCALMLVERDARSGKIVGIAAVIVGRKHKGVKVQAGVYYSLINGGLVESGDQS